MAGNKKWRRIVDFTKIKKGGISAEELLKRLRNLNRIEKLILGH